MLDILAEKKRKFLSLQLDEELADELVYYAVWQSERISEMKCPNMHQGNIEKTLDKRYYCRDCRAIFSVRKNTPFANTKCGLIPWLYIIYIMGNDSNVFIKGKTAARITKDIREFKMKINSNSKPFHRASCYSIISKIKFALSQRENQELIKRIYYRMKAMEIYSKFNK